MKRVYSLLAFALLFSIAATAQLTIQKKEKRKQPVSSRSPVIQNFYSGARLQPHTSGHTPNAAIWTDDFSNASHWTITHEAGTSSDWVIGTSGPNGSFPLDPINSSTAANGFALFDSDAQCDSINGQIAHLTTVNPINCSANAGVSLTFSEYYSRFWDSTFVYVSNNGTTWTRFDVNKNMLPNATLANNPTSVSVNISSAAAHQATVYIRFTFYSPVSLNPGAAGCNYSWMIDDVSLNDLVPTDVGIFTPATAGEYSIIPINQIEAFQLGARVVNTGTATATNVGSTFDVFLGNIGNNVFSDASAPIATLNAGDTTPLLTPTLPFTPTDTGIYGIQYVSYLNGPDGDPTNDTVLILVYVTDSIYSRDLTSLDGGVSFYGSFGFPGFTGYFGQIYHVYQGSQFTSATFYLDAAVLNDKVDVAVFSVSPLGVPDQLLGSSAQYTLTPSDTGGAFITLGFSSPISVNPGDYLVALHQLNTRRVTLGIADEIFTLGKVFYKAGNAPWASADTGVNGIRRTFMLSVNNPSATFVGVDPVNKNLSAISVFPNPAKDEIFIVNTGSSENATVNILNAVGQIIWTKVYDHLSKERIDLSSQPDGIYTVSIQTSSGIQNKSIVLSGK